MTGWIRGVHLVDRVNETAAEVLAPDLIHNRSGEDIRFAAGQGRFDELRSTADRGRGRRLLVLLQFLELLLFFFLFVVVWFGRVGFVDRHAGEEHKLGVARLAGLRLEVELAVRSFARKTAALKGTG